MKNPNHVKLIFIAIFFMFFSSISKSDVKVAFVEIDRIIKESSSGKSMIQQLAKLDNDNKKYFKETKEQLSIEKKKLLHKKIFYLKKNMKKKLLF